MNHHSQVKTLKNSLKPFLSIYRRSSATIMSASSRVVVSRLSTRFLSPLKPNKAAKLATSPLLSSPLKPTSAKRISSVVRLPVELSCLMSMMPLHSAIASARLTSILSTDSRSCLGLIPQGISLPL